MHRKTQIFLKLKYDETIGECIVVHWKFCLCLLAAWGIGITEVVLFKNPAFTDNIIVIGVCGILAAIVTAFVVGIIIFAICVLHETFTNIIKDGDSFVEWARPYKTEVKIGVGSIILGLCFTILIDIVPGGGFTEGRRLLAYVIFTVIFGTASFFGIQGCIAFYKSFKKWIDDNWEKAEIQYQHELNENKTD